METKPISSLKTHALGSLTVNKANSADRIVEKNIWKKTTTITAGYFFMMDA